MPCCWAPPRWRTRRRSRRPPRSSVASASPPDCGSTSVPSGVARRPFAPRGRCPLRRSPPCTTVSRSRFPRREPSQYLSGSASTRAAEGAMPALTSATRRSGAAPPRCRRSGPRTTTARARRRAPCRSRRRARSQPRCPPTASSRTPANRWSDVRRRRRRRTRRRSGPAGRSRSRAVRRAAAPGWPQYPSSSASASAIDSGVNAATAASWDSVGGQMVKLPGQAVDRALQLIGHQQPAQPPARHREVLRETVDHQRLLAMSATRSWSPVQPS